MASRVINIYRTMLTASRNKELLEANKRLSSSVAGLKRKFMTTTVSRLDSGVKVSTEYTRAATCVRILVDARLYSTSSGSNLDNGTNDANVGTLRSLMNRCWFQKPSSPVQHCNWEKSYKELAVRYATLEKKCDKFIAENAKSEEKLESANAEIIELKMLLGFRSEIEDLEFFLWPVSKEKHTNRTEVWMGILKSDDPVFTTDPLIIEFRNRLISNDISPDFFIMECVLQFYERSSTLGGHKVKFPKRSQVTTKIIINVLDTIGLPTHDAYLKAVNILLSPIKSVN